MYDSNLETTALSLNQRDYWAHRFWYLMQNLSWDDGPINAMISKAKYALGLKE
jgi:hypothetical protein